MRNSVISDDGRINENGAPYTGMMRFDVRVKLEEDLKSKRNEMGIMCRTWLVCWQEG